ncbi:MAG: hypothetical protein GXP49_08275 [Deltaproteobacteria bacterium]|nr:hypothetical protein [Deltaproteobacteria bacterium]
MDLGLPAAFVAGTLTLLTPCILPMLPILLGIMLGASAQTAHGKQRGKLVWSVALFSIGFTIVFTLLGIGASGIGDVMREHRTLLLWIGSGILALFGLKMLGLLRIPFLDRTVAVKAPNTGRSGLDAVLGGIVFGLGWSPCAGPILGSVLTVAAASSSTWSYGALLLLSYSAGIAVPLLVIAGFGQALLPRVKMLNSKLPLIEKVTGALLLLGAVGLALGAGLPAGLMDDNAPTTGISLQGPIEPPLGKEASPRLVEFFKHDCPSCQKSRTALNELKHDCIGRRIQVIEVDVEHPENKKLVKSFGIRAVPTFVALDGGGKERVRFIGTRNLKELRAVAASLVGVCAGVGPDGANPNTRKGTCPKDHVYGKDPQLCGG